MGLVAGSIIAGTAVGAGQAIGGGIAGRRAAKQQASNTREQGRITRAETLQSARQMRKAHARTKAMAVTEGLAMGVVGGSQLDLLAENAGELELEAVAKDRFAHNAWEMAKVGATAQERAGNLAVVTSTFGGISSGFNVASGVYQLGA